MTYDNFIEHLITDWRNGDSEKKALKIWGSVRRIGIFPQFKDPFLHENTVFAPNPSSNFSIEDSKICENQISKSTLGPCLRYFNFAFPTQNPVFQQLVPFDMLSHILQNRFRQEVMITF